MEKPPVIDTSTISENVALEIAANGIATLQRDKDAEWYEKKYLIPDYEYNLQQARQDTASTLFETIELMYPELRSVYWKGEKWQSFKSEHLIPPNPVGSADL